MLQPCYSLTTWPLERYYSLTTGTTVGATGAKCAWLLQVDVPQPHNTPPPPQIHSTRA